MRAQPPQPSTSAFTGSRRHDVDDPYYFGHHHHNHHYNNQYHQQYLQDEPDPCDPEDADDERSFSEMDDDDLMVMGGSRTYEYDEGVCEYSNRGDGRRRGYRGRAWRSRRRLRSRGGSAWGNGAAGGLGGGSGGYGVNGRIFPTEDTRPTSVKELLGWYSYAWAAEAFAVCGLGSFIPLTLEALARGNGVVKGSNGMKCGAPGSAELSLFGYGEDIGIMGGLGGVGEGERDGVEQCIVYILGWGVNTASFAMYTFSISVFLQSIVIISMSGAADHGNYRKLLLLLFAFLGSISTILFITVTPSWFLLSSLWAILGNIGFGASFVLLNAFLPVLVRNHPLLLSRSPPETPIPPHEEHALLSSSSSTNIPNHDQNHNSYSAITSPDTLTNTSTTPGNTSYCFDSSTCLDGSFRKPENHALTLSSQISSYGIAIGYCGAVLMQTFGIALVLMTGSTTWSLQLVLGCIGTWWFAFTVPSALWLRSRPGPPLPSMSSSVIGGGVKGWAKTWWTYISYSWKGLWRTAKRARRLKDVMLFLAAWFMISDGVATVSGTAILFAKTNLHMKPAEVALISVISTLFGVMGAFGWSKLSLYFGISPARTILILIGVFELIPLYGLLGFLPSIRDRGIIGLTNPYEMYILGAVYGFVLGGIGGYCRSVFGELIPPGSEAAFYALYAITDKGSSVVGPVVVGALTEKYGDIRAGFWFLSILLALPVPLVWMVDVERGRREGRRVAREVVVEDVHESEDGWRARGVGSGEEGGEYLEEEERVENGDVDVHRQREREARREYSEQRVEEWRVDLDVSGQEPEQQGHGRREGYR